VLSSAVLDFAPGDPIFLSGDDSTELYLVMRGVVQVTVPTDSISTELIVDEFGAGEVFGDVAMLADEPRRANAVALTHATLLVLTREAIANATLFHPFVSSRLFYNLARDVSRRWVDFIIRVKAKEDIEADFEEEEPEGASQR
jgi:CRP-like cAMP-binding protein